MTRTRDLVTFEPRRVFLQRCLSEQLRSRFHNLTTYFLALAGALG